MNVPELDLAAELAALASLERVELAARWESAFGCRAPLSCQAPLLRGALAWHLQAQAQRSSRLDVDRAAIALRKSASAPLVDALSPGTRLLREWQGQTHHVTVVERIVHLDAQTPHCGFQLRVPE